MISVVRVMGESFDLETGQQTPKAIVLSNGHQELSILVDDSTAMQVIGLILGEEDETKEAPEFAPTVSNALLELRSTLLNREEPVVDPFSLSPSVQEDEDNCRGPGEVYEEYGDPGTGASSI